MKELKRKITRLEEQVNMKAVPQEDGIQVVLGSEEQIEAKIRRRRAELIEKYGPQAIEEIRFIEVIDRFNISPNAGI